VIPQRSPKSPRVLEVRPLVEADLEQLREKSVGSTRVKHLRDSHHMVARLIAAGHRLPVVAHMTGYSLARIYTLSMDPSLKDLVAKYRNVEDEVWRQNEDANAVVASELIAKGLRHYRDHFDQADEAGELIPIASISKIIPDLMDRFGQGKRSTNVSINLDFAKSLEEMRARRDALAKEQKRITTE
jgi:hypothetical protein